MLMIWWGASGLPEVYLIFGLPSDTLYEFLVLNFQISGKVWILELWKIRGTYDHWMFRFRWNMKNGKIEIFRFDFKWEKHYFELFFYIQSSIEYEKTKRYFVAIQYLIFDSATKIEKTKHGLGFSSFNSTSNIGFPLDTKWLPDVSSKINLAKITIFHAAPP